MRLKRAEKKYNRFLQKRQLLCITNLLPSPSKYVFVPCSVIGPGLHPKIRINFEVIRVIIGIDEITVDDIFLFIFCLKQK